MLLLDESRYTVFIVLFLFLQLSLNLKLFLKKVFLRLNPYKKIKSNK